MGVRVPILVSPCVCTVVWNKINLEIL